MIVYKHSNNARTKIIAICQRLPNLKIEEAPVVVALRFFLYNEHQIIENQRCQSAR